MRIPLCAALLSSLLAGNLGCKPRQQTANVLDTSNRRPITVDRAVVDDFRQRGKELSKNLEWTVRKLKDNSFEQREIQWMSSVIRAEAFWARNLGAILKQFEDGSIQIDAQLARKIEAKELAAGVEDIKVILDVTWKPAQMASGPGLEQLFALDLLRVKNTHDDLIARLANWRDGGDGPVLDGARRAEPEVFMVNEEPAEPQAVNDCPKAPIDARGYMDRQVFWKLMSGYMTRLAKPETARNLGLPSVKQLDAAVREMNGTRVNAIGPGDCGPGRELSQCAGRAVIEMLSRVKELKCLYDAPSGVSEGYTLGQHTLMMMQVYASQRTHVQLPEYHDLGMPAQDLLPIILALHDIGKPVAVAAGDRNRQHEFTLPIVHGVMSAMGYKGAQIKLAETLVNDDTLGPMLMAIDAGHGHPDQVMARAATSIRSGAEGLSLSPVDYLRLQTLYYIADAASYPELQKRVFKVCEAGRLCSRNGALERLPSVLETGVAARPVPRPADANLRVGDRVPVEHAVGGGGGEGFRLDAAPDLDLDSLIQSGVDYGGLTKDASPPDSSPYRLWSESL